MRVGVEKGRNALEFSKEFFYRPGCSSLVGVTGYIPKLQKLRVESLSVDSNSRKVIIVEKVKGLGSNN